MIESTAPSGVVEFIPKNDPMVQELLRLREDIFDNYNEEFFLKSLQSRAGIRRAKTISESGRRLFCYERKLPLGSRLTRSSAIFTSPPGKMIFVEATMF